MKACAVKIRKPTMGRKEEECDVIDYCRIFQPKYAKASIFRQSAVSPGEESARRATNPSSPKRSAREQRNDDLRSQKIITEDGVRNVPRKFLAANQAKLLLEDNSGVDRRAPGGILKTKSNFTGGAPLSPAAGHVSLNVVDNTSLRNSVKDEEMKSRLFSPILSLRNNFTGDFATTASQNRNSLTGFDGQGLRVKRMNETYNSIDLKEKLTKYRLNSSQNNKFRIRQKRIKCGTDNENSMAGTSPQRRNVRTTSVVSPDLTSNTFDRSNVDLNQRFYDKEVEKILDEKLRHVTITREIIKQNNPGFKMPLS